MKTNDGFQELTYQKTVLRLICRWIWSARCVLTIFCALISRTNVLPPNDSGKMQEQKNWNQNQNSSLMPSVIDWNICKLKFHSTNALSHRNNKNKFKNANRQINEKYSISLTCSQKHFTFLSPGRHSKGVSAFLNVSWTEQLGKKIISQTKLCKLLK